MLQNQKNILLRARRLHLPMTVGLSLLSRSTSALAATEARGVANNLMPIIHMLQDFAFPILGSVSGD